MINIATQQQRTAADNLLRFTAWVVLAILITLLAMNVAHAEDLMVGGKDVVDDTFGQGSTFSKWLILGEVVFGVFAYIKTKNLILLGGVAVVIAFTTIGFNLAA